MVEVVPPSELGEGSWVFLAASFVVLCVMYIVAFERQPALETNAAAARALLPFQVLFRDLASAEQRVFREMQEGVTEAVTVRGSSGRWPMVEDLAAQGVPPFAVDALDKSTLRWGRRDAGLLHQYVGVPAAAASPAFLISILEPEPATGEKPLPGVVDEEHQLLSDGTLLHVTYWTRTGGVTWPEPISDPGLAGWKQIRVKTPLEEFLEAK
ncbi:MAG TPA: DUF6162 family protein [Candidatus Margulisiibacteriota bacterium]|nr:DUF6162 family protein [Candidatus Margulisiibacteriota bacterium]